MGTISCDSAPWWSRRISELVCSDGNSTAVKNIKIRLPDRTIPLEVYGTPIWDKTGTIVAAIATFSDITERKQTEQILADYNQTLEIQVRERTVELNEAQRLGWVDKSVRDLAGLDWASQ